MKSTTLVIGAVMAAITLALHAADLPEAVKLPKGGRDLLTVDGPGAMRPLLPKVAGEATAELMPVADAPWTGFWRFKIIKRPVNSWSVQLTAKIQEPIAKGDKCLLLFHARAAEGKASGAANVEVARPPEYPKLGSTQFRVGTKWEPVILPFTAGEEGPPGLCAVAIHLGGEVQTVDLGGLRLLNYGPDLSADTLPQPRFTYEGREPDAPWRKAALERIEKHRKSDFTLSLVDRDGRPVANADVRVVLRRHAFGFGSAVTAAMLNDPSPDGVRYRAIVDECFSRVVFENDLKPGPWEAAKNPEAKGSFRKIWLDKSLQWLADRRIEVRGHYLCWAPFEPWSEKLRDKPQAIREKVLAYMREITPAIGGQVCEWDALNHPAGWEAGMCIDTVLGGEFYAEVFREARKLTRLPLWINEDQVFRPGRQQEEYFQIIGKLLASGIRPDGIGNQAHFHSSFLPSPEEMLANSDRFAKLVPALQITEFDVNTNGDERLAADYTRDLLITTFSHPAYTGFVMWGFWEGAHWKPETALWRKDWSEKPAAQVWRDLVCQQWHTDEALHTDTGGTTKLRGFYGRYEVTVKGQTISIDLTKSTKESVKVVVGGP